MLNITPENPQQNQTTFTSSGSMAEGTLPPHTKAAEPANNPPLFYTQEDDLDLHLPENEHQGAQDAPFVLPFQSSTAMPTITHLDAPGVQGSMGAPSSPPPGRNTQQHSLRLLKFFLIGGVVFFTMIGGGLLLFAQSAPSPNTAQQQGMQASRTTTIQPATRPLITPGASTQKKTTVSAAPPTRQSTPASQPPQSNQVPATSGASSPTPGIIPSAQRLSDLGWTQAGLSAGDAIEALRTATTFTDREMSYDYRNIGTLTAHSVTLTSARFLLTPGGQVRFANNDVRVINNVLYEKITSEKLIHQVVNAQATLVQLQGIAVQGRVHFCAWITVSFSLFQSRIDPASGQRTEGLLHNPATGQPATYQMAVVVVWVMPQNQGPSAPMGGTGWLVNTYALDAPTSPTLQTTPSI